MLVSEGAAGRQTASFPPPFMSLDHLFRMFFCTFTGVSSTELVVGNTAAGEPSCCDLSLLSWLRFGAKILFIYGLCGSRNLSETYRFPLSFDSQLIIPLIQHLRINVYQLTVLNSKLVGLSSPQGGNENVLLDSELVKYKTELEAKKPVGLVFCVFSVV